MVDKKTIKSADRLCLSSRSSRRQKQQAAFDLPTENKIRRPDDKLSGQLTGSKGKKSIVTRIFQTVIPTTMAFHVSWPTLKAHSCRGEIFFGHSYTKFILVSFEEMKSHLAGWIKSWKGNWVRKRNERKWRQPGYCVCQWQTHGQPDLSPRSWRHRPRMGLLASRHQARPRQNHLPHSTSHQSDTKPW